LLSSWDPVLLEVLMFLPWQTRVFDYLFFYQFF